LGENLSFTIQGYCMDDRFAVDNENILESVLDLMADLLFHPMTENGMFRDDFFEQEKINHADLIRSIINDKRVFSMMRCKEIMFEKSAYRFSSNGTLEYLEQISNASLYEFYRNMLQKSCVMITYIGRKVDLEGLTRKYFPDILSSCGSLAAPSQFVRPDRVREVCESYDVAQGKLCMGFRLTSAVDYFASRLFNVVFGGSPTSKLFMNVRERLSLCYYCSSIIDPYVNSMFISSGIEFENFEVAKGEIMHQLDDMKQGNITAEEFENGKLYLLDYIKGIKDSHGLMLANKLQNHLLGFEYTIDEQLQKVAELELQDIVRVAKCIEPDTVYFLKGIE